MPPQEDEGTRLGFSYHIVLPSTQRPAWQDTQMSEIYLHLLNKCSFVASGDDRIAISAGTMIHPRYNVMEKELTGHAGPIVSDNYNWHWQTSEIECTLIRNQHNSLHKQLLPASEISFTQKLWNFIFIALVISNDMTSPTGSKIAFKKEILFEIIVYNSKLRCLCKTYYISENEKLI